MMWCGSRKPLRGQNHGLFTTRAWREQQGSECWQAAPGAAPAHCSFQGCLGFFSCFLFLMREGMLFACLFVCFKINVVFFCFFFCLFLNSSLMKHSQFPGVECISTCKYYSNYNLLLSRHITTDTTPALRVII